MRTSEINFATLLTFLFCCAFTALNAQTYNVDSHKWGENPEDFMPHQKVLELENIVATQKEHLDRVKNIYTSCSTGDVFPLRSYAAPNMNWNDQSQFPFFSGDPHLGSDALLTAVCNKMGEGWFHWKLYDITYEEHFDNVITVSGRYKANHRTQSATDAAFLHVWTWKNGKIVEFQHYEPVQAMANR